VTTNQATLCAVLRAMRIDTPLSGKGRLLETMPQG
jgi:maleate cis-trans isomerase